ncbi:hypothetical protein RRG08_000265 [Elysia crispata]|uniref:Uncharacterized protein n=1 Tax=Elysia crispata TaxID=231223 RepID=A0AAE1CU99_9GAST|nr:hypothetical protein RRG08_000265 [Elysia crispata]
MSRRPGDIDRAGPGHSLAKLLRTEPVPAAADGIPTSALSARSWQAREAFHDYRLQGMGFESYCCSDSGFITYPCHPSPYLDTWLENVDISTFRTI